MYKCDIKDFDKLYIDRIYGFSFYEDQPEPILRNNDNYKLFINECISKKVTVFSNDILQKLEEIISEGNMIQLAMEMYDTQGNPYYTSSLIEDYEDGNFIFTKISETTSDICKTISPTDLLNRLDLTNERMEIEVLSLDIKYIKSKFKEFTQTKKYIYEDGLMLYLDKQTQFLESKKDTFTKQKQLRLSKHYVNKIYPIVYSLMYNGELYATYADKLIQLLEKHKFISSLVLGKNTKEFQDSYIQLTAQINNLIDQIRREYERSCI